MERFFQKTFSPDKEKDIRRSDRICGIFLAVAFLYFVGRTLASFM